MASPLLAPKLAIVVDGRGRFDLDHLTADIRAVAVGDGQWRVAIDAETKSVWPIHVGSADTAISAIGILLDLLIAGGRHCRMRDVPPAGLRAAFLQAGNLDRPKDAGIKPGPGILTLSGGRTVLGLRPRFGQMMAAAALAFIAEAEACGVSEFRLAPDRTFFVVELRDHDAEALRSVAQRYDLSADAHDPAARIAACAGAGACASGFYQTKALAERMLAGAPDLFNGSLDIHFSGCSKGCAHPRPALTIVGAAECYGIVLDGRADEAADITIAGGGIDFAIEKLAQLAGTQRQAGESVAGCLQRLGAATIAEALRQE
jgi:precorrin-3B synthase